MRNPLHVPWIQANQFEDVYLNTRSQESPQLFPIKHINQRPLICYRTDPQATENEWKICIPTTLLPHMIRWFHLVLGHAGQTRVYDSIRRLLYHPHLKRSVGEFKCEVCQRHKLPGAGYGELPAKEAAFNPWEEVHVDLIGPWKIKLGEHTVEFNALTCIDPVTNLVELIRIKNKTSQHVAKQFENHWLARYPWPVRCVHDNGGEFTGWEFLHLLEATGIQNKPTTSRNPQSNAVCERMHQTVGNILRALMHGHPPATADQATDVVDNALATAMHATRAAVSRTLGNNSPGSLAFQRDMLMNIPMQANLEVIRQRRQLLIDDNLRRQNAKRRDHDYAVGDQVLVKNVDPTKLGKRSNGPYTLLRVHTNGTVTIRRNSEMTERLNIRRIFPFRT